MKTPITLLFFSVATILLMFSQCKKDKTIDDSNCKTTLCDTASDEGLFNKAMAAGFTYYKGDSSYLGTTSASGHAPLFFRVRYNAIAYSALTDSGRLPVGGTFPEGSMVVKELYDAPGAGLSLIAIMEKSTGNTVAAANWLWGEYYGDGSLGISVSRKGDQCTGCHDDSGNRDYVRLFAFYP